jgi:hypothetical protein
VNGRWYNYGQGTKVEIFRMNRIVEAVDLIFDARKSCLFRVYLKGREVKW